MSYLRRFLCLAISALSFSAHAIPATLGLLLGKPLVFVDLDEQTRKPLGALGSLGLEFSIPLPDYPFSLGVFYESFVKSDFGALPASSSGINISYFPFKKPMSSLNESGEVKKKSLGMSIYGTLGSGLSFLNIRGEGGSFGTFVFGAAAFNLRLSANLDYPIDDQFAVGSSVLYQTTFGGTSGEDPFPTVGFTGFSILARLSFTLP